MTFHEKFSRLTKEELWHLFPIILTEHNEDWKKQYSEEERRIHSFLQFDGLKISHIGSTAINGICAKPIIDILVEIPESILMATVNHKMISNGYICMARDEKRFDYNKGYTEKGFADKVFHLHLRYLGDNDELYFRDYLNDNQDIAKEYENLKISLFKQYEFDRDAYTDAKSEFIKEQTANAKNEYGERYKRLV